MHAHWRRVCACVVVHGALQCPVQAHVWARAGTCGERRATARGRPRRSRARAPGGCAAADAACVRAQTGEYYNREANIMDDVARFRKAAYTKDLLRSVGTEALAYCTTSSWSPCESDDSTYDDAGIV